MSVNAYRINKIQTVKSPTFNLWHDRALMEFIEANSDFMNGLNDDANGVSELPVEVLEKVFAKATELKLDADTVKAVKRDIAWAKRRNQEYITYQCY